MLTIARENSEGNKEHVIGNWKKINPWYIVAENLAKLYSTGIWKVEFVSNEFGYLDEAISSKQMSKLGSDFFFFLQ